MRNNSLDYKHTDNILIFGANMATHSKNKNHSPLFSMRMLSSSRHIVHLYC